MGKWQVKTAGSEALMRQKQHEQHEMETSMGDDSALASRRGAPGRRSHQRKLARNRLRDAALSQSCGGLPGAPCSETPSEVKAQPQAVGSTFGSVSHASSRSANFGAKGGKPSWADITDAEFKARNGGSTEGVDPETASIETPSTYVASGECSSNSGGETSDAEQDVDGRKSKSPVGKACNGTWGAVQWAMPIGFPVIVAVPMVPQPVCEMDFSDMGEWASFAYQAMCETGGMSVWWPSHLQSYPAVADGGDVLSSPHQGDTSVEARVGQDAEVTDVPSSNDQSKVSDVPSEDGVNKADSTVNVRAERTPLGEALAKARAAACTHQRALNKVRHSATW
jgi:hypothetical protein